MAGTLRPRPEEVDPDKVLECILVRSDEEAVVVDGAEVEPGARPETVY